VKWDVWFALSPDRPHAVFAVICRPHWTGVRKIKTGLESTDLFAFFDHGATSGSRDGPSKAMPVILTEQARALQRPLPEVRLSR
jgi:hypothetical protein